MRLLALLIFVFSAQAALAGSASERPCDGDLAETLSRRVLQFELHPRLYPGKVDLEVKVMTTAHLDCIDELIALARKLDMSIMPHAEKHFMAELEWARDLLKKGEDEIYRVANIYEAKNDDTSYEFVIAMRLRIWLEARGYAPALFDAINPDPADRFGIGIGQIEDLARKGYGPAILDLGRRYLKGDATKQSLGAAWYWLKRAQQKKLDISSITSKSLNRLLAEMNRIDWRVLTVLSNAHADLDFRDIEFLPSKLTWSSTTPNPLSDREVRAFAERLNRLDRPAGPIMYGAFKRELYARAAGIDHWSYRSSAYLLRPLGMGAEAFSHRICLYFHAVEQVFSRASRVKWTVLDRKYYVLVFLISEYEGRTSSPFIRFKKYTPRTMLPARRCSPTHPNPKIQAMVNALIWAKKMENMPPATLRKLADTYFKKSGSKDKRKFKPATGGSSSKDAPEAYKQHSLARKINDFAEIKEEEKRLRNR